MEAPPIPANEWQYESIVLEVPYVVIVSVRPLDLAPPEGGGGGSAGTRAWAAVAG